MTTSRHCLSILFASLLCVVFVQSAYGAPTLTSISPTALSPGMQVTFTGSGFGATQGSGSVGFNNTAGTVVSWSDTQVVATVAAGTNPGNAWVTQNGTRSNYVAFTMVPPTLTSISPTALSPGRQVTFTGSGFGATQGSGSVGFNNTAGTVVSWSDTQVVATVAAGTNPGNAWVTQNGTRSNYVAFTMVPPTLTSISPTALSPGIQVTFTGSGFGVTRGSGSVGFNNTAGTVVSWSDTQVVATVAAGTNPGNAWVTQNGTRSNYVSFTMVPPTLTSISPTALKPGMQVTFTGSGFGATQGSGSVGFNNTAGTVVSWSDTQVVATVAAGTNPGNAWITQNGTRSNYVAFTMVPPTLTSLSPTALAPGMQVTFTGSGFGATQGSGSVGFNNTAGTVVSWSDTQVVAAVAAGTNPGNAWVTQNGTRSNYVAFTMVPPTLTSISPTALSPGIQVTFTGSGFGVTRGSGSVGFNNTAGTVVSWSDTQVVATVAAGTNPGNAWVTQNGTRSNYVAFTMVPPTLTSISPTALSPGMQVTFTGSGFGTTQGSGSVGFNNTAGTVVSWSDTQVVATVAAGTNPGNAWVTQNGTRSNYLPFTIVPAPVISSLSPKAASVGTSITISGTNLGSSSAGNAITFNGVSAIPTSWSQTTVIVPVPGNATSGNVVVTISGLSSNGLPFTVITAPSIAALSPVSGAIGTQVTISGSNFGATQGPSTVTFNGSAASPISWNNGAIVVAVPSGATTGPVVVSVGGQQSNSVNFSVYKSLTSISVAPNSPALSAGRTQQFTATGNYSDGSTQDLTATAQWTSSVPTVAAVNGSGLAVSIAAGQTTIQASVGSISGSASVSVTALPAGGSLLYPRFLHSATRLNDGTILIAGGTNGGGGIANNPNIPASELYNEQAGTFSPVGSLVTPRNTHTASLLNNGSVLLTGGYDNYNNALASAEVYNPATQTFSGVGSMSTSRTLHTATVMSGLVLVTGGVDVNFNNLASVEVYNPAAGMFVGTGSMTTARNTHTATRLNDGTVLVTGGYDSNFTALASAETYDPGTGSFTAVGNMTMPRGSQTATLLNNGKVLIVGGYDDFGNPLANAELYDPQSQTFAPTAGNLTNARALHTATLLMDGTVLIAGGQAGYGNTVSSMELYDPATGNFSPAGTLSTGRYYHTVARLDDGSVLLAGGQNSTFGGFSFLVNTLGSTETYQPSNVTPPGLVSIMISPSGPSFPAGISQSLAAIGTYADNSIQTLASPNWTTSDVTLATVTSDATNSGDTFGVAQGTPIITACAGGICGSTVPTVGAPLLAITDLSPSSGAPGMPVTISGTQFGSSQGTVTFSGTPASILSWGPMAIVVSVPAGATSGKVVVSVNGINSNGLPFAIVPRPQITDVSPNSGAAGTQVTVTGSNFGGTQGNGVITFNGTPGTVSSWSDSAIVVSVPNAASTGNVEVTVSGLTSNAVLFTVPAISNINPYSGPPGILLTIIGSGFGATQGSGTAMVGNVQMTIFTWTDSQIVGAPGPGTTSGTVTVQQGALTLVGPTFTVNSSFPYNVSPNGLSMVVGESKTVSVTDPGTSNPITGLSWFATDSTIVSLSADDPPIITALAPGSITVYAGEVPIAINVYASISAMPPGTPIWTVPAGVSGPISVVPAVPSSNGVDAFTLDSAGTLTGFSADGIPKGKISGVFSQCNPCSVVPATIIPDFSGNAVVKSLYTFIDGNGNGHSTHVVRQADLTTQKATDLYTFSDYQDASLVYPLNQQYSDKYSPEVVIPHPSGMVFIQDFANISVIDPTGAQGTTTISLPIPPTSDPRQGDVGKMIIAGDGNAYIPYVITDPGPTYTANVMRVSSDGTYTPIQLGSSPTSFSTPIAITNADQGVAVFTRRTAPTTTHLDIYYASQSGPTSQVLDAAVFPSDGSGPFQFTPALQREDGSYIGTDGGQNYIMALGAGGGILWQQQLGSFLQGNNVPIKPLYATADGGVIFTTSPSAYDCAGGDLVAGASPGCQYSLSANPYSRGLLPTDAGYSQLGSLFTLDQNGNPAVDQNGNPIPPAADTGALFSWTGEWYSSAGSSVSALSPSISLTVDQASLWSVTGGNPTGNGVAIPQCPCLLQSIGGSLPLGQVEVPQARLSPRVLAQPSPPVGCLICTLTPPTQTQTPDEPTCAVFVGTGPTYLILVGDQGLPPHDVGDGFNLAAQTEANILKAQGNYVAACRVSSLQNVLNALTKFGAINGGVIYFGHSGPFSFHLGSTFLGNMSILAVGQASGTDTNISYKNSQQLAVVQTALNGNQNILGSHAAILLNGCRAAEDVHDYALSTASIAQLVAQSTQRGVYGYRVGMYFSLNDVANATSWNYAQEPNPVPEVLPLYLVPEGRPQHKPQPTLCTPQGGCQK